MAKKITYLNSDSNIIDLFVQYKEPFTVAITNQTTTVKKDGRTWILSDNFMKMKHLSFIKKVKDFCRKLDPIPDFHASISYMQFREIDNGFYQNYLEIDLNAAYWEMALRLGYISNEIYLQGLEVPKMVRLVALGALATSRAIYEFDGKDMIYKDREINKETRNFFFHVSHEVDYIMSSIFEKAPVLWYWVDAFFVHQDYEKIVVEEIKKTGLKCSVDKVNSIRVQQLKSGRQLATVKMMCGKEKPFFVIDKNMHTENLVKRTKDIITRIKADKELLNAPLLLSDL